MFGRADSLGFDSNPAPHGIGTGTVPTSGPKSIGPAIDPTADLARRFLRLANLPTTRSIARRYAKKLMNKPWLLADSG